MNPPLYEGSWVRIEHFGRHKAVVLRVIGQTHVLVMYATSTCYAFRDPLIVMPDSASGRQLGLTLPTYFYPTNCVAKRTSKVLESLGRCPPKLYAQLRILAAPQLANLDHLTSAEIDELAQKADHRQRALSARRD